MEQLITKNKIFMLQIAILLAIIIIPKSTYANISSATYGYPSEPDYMIEINNTYTPTYSEYLIKFYCNGTVMANSPISIYYSWPYNLYWHGAGIFCGYDSWETSKTFKTEIYDYDSGTETIIGPIDTLEQTYKWGCMEPEADNYDPDANVPLECTIIPSENLTLGQIIERIILAIFSLFAMLSILYYFFIWIVRLAKIT